MKLRVISSGSEGNCYALIDSEQNVLLIEAGLPMRYIKRALNYQVKDFVGVVFSHRHYDHYAAYFDILKMGYVPMYCPFDEPNVVKPFPRWKGKIQAVPMTDKDGNFTHTNNNGERTEIYGYLISHPEMNGVLFYCTDCELIKWRFKGISNVILGINYADELMQTDNEAKANHVYKGHLELQTGIDFLKETEKQNKLNNVLICHISNENGNKQYFYEKVKNALKPETNVFVAEKKLEIEL